MKKIILAGLVAISALAITQQEASAWINSRFGVGLNWDLQTGGNSFLWGAWRNGQQPGPEAFGAGGAGPRFGAPFGNQPIQAPPPFGGGPMQPQFSPTPQYFGAPQGFAPMPQGAFDAQQFEAPFASQFSSPYQFANYPRPSTYYYPSTPYYYYGR